MGNRKGASRLVEDSVRLLWHDQRGAVAVYIGIITTALIGFGALWLDVGRLFTLHTEQQSAADSFALACARELDGEAGSRGRATLAAQGVPGGVPSLVSNTQTFAFGESEVQVQQIRFLSSLPPDDQPIDASYEATGDDDAHFCEVTVTDRDISNFFMPVVGGPTTNSTGAVAVAGQTDAMCRFPPLAVCNPDEARVGIGAPFDIEHWRGKQLLAKTKGGGSAAWVPGDFGLVDTTSGAQGAKAIAEQLAAVDPDTPCVSAKVDLKPGTTDSTRNALNTRFDMCGNPFFACGSWKNDPRFRPARNVTKGLLRSPGNGCSYEDPPGGSPPVAMGLPRDSNIGDATRFGNGDWDRTEYWNINHPSEGPLPAGMDSATRWEMYKYELSNNIPDNSAIGGEDGNFQCYNNAAAPPSDDLERRTIYFVVLNCVADGPIAGNSAGDIPVRTFVKALLTEPVGGEPDTDIYLEMVDVAEPGVDDVFHEIVQLYR